MQAMQFGSLSGNGSTTPLDCSAINTRGATVQLTVVPTLSVLVEGSQDGVTWATVLDLGVSPVAAMGAFTTGTVLRTIASQHKFLRLTASGAAGSPSVSGWLNSIQPA